MYQHRRPDLNASLGPAILLARCFAPQPSFRPRLWREVQDMIAKCVLSENMQTPACFLAVSILFQGAGASVRDWMKSNLKGVGRDWIFYMGQFRRPADIWTWDDVMRERLEHDMGSIFEQNLPRDLLELRHEMKMYARTGILPRRLPVRSSPKRLNGYPRGCEP